ncbi:hypothetical protein C8J56DRAFT_1165633, partial [Mycena floridula]
MSQPSHSSSSYTLTCINDDSAFIRNVHEGNMVYVQNTGSCEGRVAGGNRVALFWRILQLGRHLPSRIAIDLLQGGEEEDLWMWNDGDEAVIGDIWLTSPPHWLAAATVLAARLHRQSEHTALRARVKAAVPQMRVAMIAWLALTSQISNRELHHRGRSNRQQWDIQALVSDWWSSLPDRVQEWLEIHSDENDRRAFDTAMNQEGHDCHVAIQKKFPIDFVTPWLFMRGELFPILKADVVFFGYCHNTVTCAACHSRTPLKSPSLLDWTPPITLVALRCMWDGVTQRATDRDFFAWLSSKDTIGFKHHIASDQWEDSDVCFLSWVNDTYPNYSLRYTVTQYTLDEWGSMDQSLLWAHTDGPVNVRPWLLDMLWRMLPVHMSDTERMRQFVAESSVLDFLPPSNPSRIFRQAIEDSGHTCWQDSLSRYYRRSSSHRVQWSDCRDDYASVMSFLQVQPEVIGIDSLQQFGCKVCESERLLKETFVTTKLTWRLFPLVKQSSRRGLPWILSVVEQELAREACNGQAEDLTEHQATLPMVNESHRTPNIPMSLDQNRPIRSHPLQPVSYQTRDSNPVLYTMSHHDWDSHSAVLHGLSPNASVECNVLSGQLYNQPYTSTSYGTSDANGSSFQAPSDVTVLTLEATGRRATPLAISELVNPALDSNELVHGQGGSEACIVAQNMTGNPTPPVDLSRSEPLSKDDMIKELKRFFTESFERLGVELHGSKRNKKLPWIQFDDTLVDEGIEMVNWPEDVLSPGKGSNSSKGLAGVPVRDLKKIYKAIHSDTVKLELRHIPGARKPGQAV